MKEAKSCKIAEVLLVGQQQELGDHESSCAAPLIA
jgi:hypothetical protein